MNKYEAMFIIKPELTEDERKTLFGQIADNIGKNGGKLSSGDLWSERRKLTFPIKKHDEGVYYLARFELPTAGLDKLKYAFKLNENILRVMILSGEDKK
ncbi:MAG: 30S ribosomal protein S6 [Deltaproteobacteria bacterium]